MTDAEWQRQDPIVLFQNWLNEAKRCTAIREPTAMALATWSSAAGLGNRIVLLKSLTEKGLCFFTNYDSPKGRSLTENGEAAAMFYWDALARQVRITGPVTRATRGESEKYWASRPRDSQLSQSISHQSDICADRAALEGLVGTADARFGGGEIPCPENWGGFWLVPEKVEFWESRPGRLHERFLYSRAGSAWTCHRLYP